MHIIQVMAGELADMREEIKRLKAEIKTAVDAEREACIDIIVDYEDIDDEDVFAICDAIREREGK
jgi:hypothetical protein